MSFRETFILFLYLSSLFFTGTASAAGDYTISPTGSTHDQKIISDAIKAASESGGGTVYLTAGVYLVDGPVIIKSNVHLTGDPNAIIRVSSTSSQWFTGQNGIISNPSESVQNVEISGFQIDGNIKNLPREYDSTPGHKMDAGKLILFGGWSSEFAHNIRIHDMKLYNAFSDGIYLRFTDGAACYNNVISNC
jgi:polygalacturonase